LDYANNRYYSNAYGRFMTPDPYQASGGPSNPQSWNRYAYTSGDPVNFHDPAGLMEEAICDEDGNECGDDDGGSLPNQGWGCDSVYVMTAIDGVPMPSPCYFVPVFFAPPQTAATCLNGMGKAGTLYVCLHQSGSDWKNLGGDLKSLEKALANDPNCDKLLTSGGTSMSQINNVLSNPAMYYTLASSILTANNQYPFATTNDLIGGPAMVFLSSLFQAGASTYEADLTILHEMAHYTGVFGAENVPGNPSSATNDQTITKDCSKTLLGN
jgi:hypothetical protein